MKPIEFTKILNSFHHDYDPDYIESLTKDHNSDNIFARFVANVRLWRFFQSSLLSRPVHERNVRETFESISDKIKPLIIEDWVKLRDEEQFDPYRFMHLLPEYNSSLRNSHEFIPIKDDEHLYKRVFGHWGYDHEYKLALREFWRFNQEPQLLDTDVWKKEQYDKLKELCKQDLEEFKSRPKLIKQAENTNTTPLEPEEPKVRKWKHEKQYLGYIAAILIDKNRKIKMELLSKELAKYFVDENNKPVKATTIRPNMEKWRNRKREIEDSKKNFGDTEAHQIMETKRILEIEKQYIQAVIDYYIKTR